MTHHALEIHEILVNIFNYCYPLNAGKKGRSDLVALARTCRTFKDPALDVLWGQLNDLSPLARCVPGASQQSSPDKCYSFRRSLTQAEWDIIRSYTRRVRSIEGVLKLSRKSLQSISNRSLTEPLFPNLRHLSFQCTHRNIPLLLLPLPSLSSLAVRFIRPHLFLKAITSFVKNSPNLTRLTIENASPNWDIIDTGFICRWKNLQAVVCSRVSLDVITFTHLSRVPALTRLSFMLSSILAAQISHLDLPLIFSHLRTWMSYSESLDLVPCLLSQTRLPAVTSLSSIVDRCPSKQDLSAFLASIQTSGVDYTLLELCLIQDHLSGRPQILRNWRTLCMEDFRPCMTFRNLRCLCLDIAWQVDLADSDLLSLTSAWPRLEELQINMQFGWNVHRGITPDGLLQLLRTSRSLRLIAAAIDTQCYTSTDIPPPSACLGSALSGVNVLDSMIEEEAVPAIAAFFTGIVRSYRCSLRAWEGHMMRASSDQVICKRRWEDAFKQVRDGVRQHP